MVYPIQNMAAPCPGTSASLLAVYLVVRVQAEDWCSAARTLLSPLSSLCL